MRVPPQDVLLELLARAKLSAADVEERAARARDDGYWRRLVPSLGLHDDAVVADETPPRDGDVAAIADAFRSDGVLRVDCVLPADAVARMNAGVDAVRREGWPGVFAFASNSALRQTPSRQARMMTPAAVPSTGPTLKRSIFGSNRWDSSMYSGRYSPSSRWL